MLIDVLERVAADTGYNPTTQRDALLNLLQTSADELYDVLECNEIYREVTLVVPRDKIVALDNYVGIVKGVREHTSDVTFNIDTMSSPRYVKNTWEYKYRNWRQLPDSAIHTSLTAVAPLTIESSVIEDTPVTLTINGQTSVAARSVEEIVLDASPEVTTKSFGLNIFSISCRAVRTGDITIKDSDGVEIAVLRNTENKTRYQLVDVSQMFWNVDTSDDETLVDVLYKLPKQKFVQNTDMFYAGDSYDAAWYYMAMFKFNINKKDRKEEALNFRALSLQATVSDKNSKEQTPMKKLQFGRNKFYGLTNRVLGYADNYPYNYPGGC